MASSDPDEEKEPTAVLVECIENPDAGRERLPRLVGMLDDEDRRIRRYGAFACCLLADELDDDVREYVVRRLTDRLGGENVSLELTTALDYVSNRHSELVEEVLREIDEESDGGDLPLTRPGSFTRDHYYESEPERGGVGRTEVAGEDAPEDPRLAYADRESEERERTEHRREREEGTADSDESENGAEDATGTTGDATDDEATIQQRTEVSAIAARSQFDKLHILEARDQGRYADAYEALVGRGGVEQAVQLRLLNRPEDATTWPEFEQQVGEALFRWDTVDEHRHVVTVLDWETEPRPWLATMFTGESLNDRDGLTVEQALDDAVNLADAVSHLHNGGVVHGGIDPGNVAYPDDLLATSDQVPPMLDNVGLVAALRYYFRPAQCLDPRYAAPEYYDDGYGKVDHATDIYQLGAVIYRMLTGEAPYTGEFRAVRDGVLDREPTPPSERREEAPPAVDAVVSKAMAKQKLTRYETVEHLRRELDGIRRGNDG